MDVLGDLVHHDEQGFPWSADGQHRLHVVHDLLHRRAGPGARPGAGVDPAHGLEVAGGIEDVEHVGEMVLRLVILLGLLPGLPERLLGGRQEWRPLAVPLQLELVGGDQVASRAVVEPGLDHPEGGHVDVLVIPGHAADVEDHRNGVDPPAQRGPGIHQLLASGRVIPLEKRLHEQAATGKPGVVEGEAEELGEARLARAEEAGDPGGGQRRSALFVELCGDGLEQVDELVVDAGLEPPGPRVTVWEAAGDDVLGDLCLQLLRVLLMEVDDRRDVPRDVGDEEVLDLHLALSLRVDAGAVVSVCGELPHEG
jgi:hypothetical protein